MKAYFSLNTLSHVLVCSSLIVGPMSCKQRTSSNSATKADSSNIEQLRLVYADGVSQETAIKAEAMFQEFTKLQNAAAHLLAEECLINSSNTSICAYMITMKTMDAVNEALKAAAAASKVATNPESSWASIERKAAVVGAAGVGIPTSTAFFGASSLIVLLALPDILAGQASILSVIGWAAYGGSAATLSLLTKLPYVIIVAELAVLGYLAYQHRSFSNQKRQIDELDKRQDDLKVRYNELLTNLTPSNPDDEKKVKALLDFYVKFHTMTGQIVGLDATYAASLLSFRYAMSYQNALGIPDHMRFKVNGFN